MRYVIRPQPRHLKQREPVAAPRSPEHQKLVDLFDQGKLTAVEVLEFWTKVWDAERRAQ